MDAEQSLRGRGPEQERDLKESAGGAGDGGGIELILNDELHRIDPEEEKLVWETSLVDYIRDKAWLKGTKTMCREGGCGACTVTVKRRNLQTGVPHIFSVNSCLVPVLCCDGWEVTTVEKLGGTSEIQIGMVAQSGSQCGFCSPGMIMSMYSLSAQAQLDGNALSAKDVEENLDGNICRCTGYRPILDAFKSLVPKPPNVSRAKCSRMREGCVRDIEDCDGGKGCLGRGASADGCSKESAGKQVFEWTLESGQRWVKPTDLSSLFRAIYAFSSSGVKYRLVGGNTATGIYKWDGPYGAFIDLNGVAELQRVKVEMEGNQASELELVELGGGVTLAMATDALNRCSQFQGFEYAGEMCAHVGRIATTAVRNVATLAGNLMLKHTHPEFPSDLFVLLEAVGAKIKIASAPSLHEHYTLLQFLALDMTDKVVLSLHLPKLHGTYRFHSFKISRRFQNSHAIVNAGLVFKILSDDHLVVVENPRIVFGGLSPTFIHGTRTEEFLKGKEISDQDVVKNSLLILNLEVEAVARGEGDEAKYKRTLALSLLFKSLVRMVGDKASARVASAGREIQRNVTWARQDFDTDPVEWPLSQPISKLESLAQCSGEAEFINDMHPEPGELFGVFVLSHVANADLDGIDASEALGMPGVVAFLTASDIPGVNNYMGFAAQHEPIFVTHQITYAGQAVGLLVAENRLVALSASRKVQVLVKNAKKPILGIREALLLKGDGDEREEQIANTFIFPQSPHHSRTNHNSERDCVVGDEEPVKVISGEFQSGSQYHFHMETQTCICIPTEDSLKVYSSTQWMHRVQFALAQCLALPANYFQLEVRRLGGGYGGKISRSAHVACACAIAAYNLNKPVRIVLDLETNMEMIGGRLPYLTQYQATVNESGKIKKLDVTVTCDAGWSSNEVTSGVSSFAMQSCYAAENWKIRPKFVNTNTAPKTFCRAPGTTEGIAGVETIMDHVAMELKKDPLEIRRVNLLKEGDSIYGSPGVKFRGENLIPSMLDKLEASASLKSRQELIGAFNLENRWRKKGLSVVPMRYAVHTHPSYVKASVVICQVDGSVVVSHSGIEMGQGINTKVVQMVAHEFQISLFKVRIAPANNLLSPNATVTGGSITSECCSYSVKKACRMLLDRMAPTRAKLGGDAAWEVLVKACHVANVNLFASYQMQGAEAFKSYDVWGLMATEVEIDCLTGEYKISRVDVIEDAGKSLSPVIDVGQVEGSIVMGLGLWLTEKHEYDEDSGRLGTNNTWTYKPPLPKDIPEHFRVTLLNHAHNPLGILRSKGEPGVCMSCGVLLALKWAIAAARADAGNNEWFELDGPATTQDILLHCLTDVAHMSI